MSSTTRNSSSEMVMDRNGEASTSPMELVFSWTESRLAGDGRGMSGIKRRNDTTVGGDDSGYVSTTPCSSSLRQDEYDATPAGLRHPKSVKQLSFDSSAAPSLLSYQQGDPFLEYASEASMYPEPIEVSSLAVPPLSLIDENVSADWPSSDTKSPSRLFRSPLASPEVSKQITPGITVEEWRPSVSSPLRRLGLSSPRKNAGRRRSGGGQRSLPAPVALVGSGSGGGAWKRRQRSLCGLETIDLFYHLAVVKNQSLVVSKILSYLSDEDVSNVTMVSKTWKNICLGDPRTKARWINYVADRRQRKENLRVNVNAKGKNSLTPLAVVSLNHSTPLQCRQPTSPPVSPTKIRFHLFQKEAENLKSGEVLMQCPRCSLPSTCSPSLQLGQCKRISCQATFCTVCRQQYHRPDTPCPGTENRTITDTPPKRQRTGPTLSAARNKKRFLRRL